MQKRRPTGTICRLRARRRRPPQRRQPRSQRRRTVPPASPAAVPCSSAPCPSSPCCPACSTTCSPTTRATCSCWTSTSCRSGQAQAARLDARDAGRPHLRCRASAARAVHRPRRALPAVGAATFGGRPAGAPAPCHGAARASGLCRAHRAPAAARAVAAAPPAPPLASPPGCGLLSSRRSYNFLVVLQMVQLLVLALLQHADRRGSPRRPRRHPRRRPSHAPPLCSALRE